MTTLVEICALAFIAAISVLILKDASAPHPEFLILLFGLAVFIRVGTNIGQIVTFAGDLAAGAGVIEHLKVLFKGAGIAYLSDFTASICRDAGHGTLGEYVELAAKAELMILSLPVISGLLELSFGMLNV